MEKTNYIDMKTAKMVDYDKNIAPDKSGGAQPVSKTARFGDDGKITASRGVLGS